jgi:8-amino-7-oxononanoate synthase
MSTKRYEETLAKIKENNSYRILRNTVKSGKNINFEGKNYLNFSSNDYLGISSDIELWNNFLQNNILNDTSFTGSNCSSRLLTGNSEHYLVLENYLTEIYKSETALVFNSGYHVNIGILPALTTKNDLIIDDKLVHASIIDGVRLSEAKKIRYKHNDLDQLEEILKTERHLHENVFIVTESVFSMDGDLADINKLVEIKKKYDTFLYIDEAHAIGTYGKKGLGLAEELGLISEIDFIVGTFGKAVASQGAFVICSSLFKNYLINKMRSIIFTTALPPFSLIWTHFILQRITNMSKQRAHLMKLSEYFRSKISSIGFETNGSSNIVPLIVGENAKCIKLADYLQENGIFILPVRPPTVPDGTARLRFSLTSQMEYSEIDKIIDLLKKY